MSYANWNNFTTYILNDVVEYAGLLYKATVVNTNVSPVPTTATWSFIGSSAGGTIQTLSLAGNNISLTPSGGSVDVSLATTVSTTAQKTTAQSYDSGLLITTFASEVNTPTLRSFFPASATSNITLTPTLTTPTITISDGTTTNTIDKNGYTTRNTAANLTHYLNFSDSSSTGTGAIQKTAGLSCNPNTNTITATTFAGTATNALNTNMTSETATGTLYRPYIKTTGTGNKLSYFDSTNLNDWYYTTTVTNASASTTWAFPNCFGANTNNGYDIYFIFNLAASSVSFPGFNLTFTGLTTPTYTAWTDTTTTAPASSLSYSNANGYIILQYGISSGNAIYKAAPKMSIWNVKNVLTAGLQYGGRQFGSANPGATGMVDSYGYVTAVSGSVTGCTLTLSGGGTMTGSITVVVQSTY